MSVSVVARREGAWSSAATTRIARCCSPPPDCMDIAAVTAPQSASEGCSQSAGSACNVLHCRRGGVPGQRPGARDGRSECADAQREREPAVRELLAEQQHAGRHGRRFAAAVIGPSEAIGRPRSKAR